MDLVLKLIDIDKFIEEHQLKEVKTAGRGLFERVDNLDPEGLWSEEIFGKYGSRERMYKFGYVRLKTWILHPQVIPVFSKASKQIQDCIRGKGRFIVQDGKVISAQDQEGGTSPLFLYENFDKINWDEYGSKCPELKQLLSRYGKKVFYDKWLILPAGQRDIVIVGKQQRIQYSELNDLYVRLLQAITKTSNIDKYSYCLMIQQLVTNICNWIKQRMKGKTGILRGLILRKTVDFCARGTVAGDPSLDIDQIKLPWYVCLKLFEPFILHHLWTERKDIINLISKAYKMESVNIHELQRILREIADSRGASLPLFVKQQLRDVVKDVCEGRLVIAKRDPVETRVNWFAAKVVVNPDLEAGYFGVHPAICKRTQMDFDGDAIGVYSLLTEEAQEEAKKLLPSASRVTWIDVKSYGSQHHTVELDAAAIIYYATSK